VTYKTRFGLVIGFINTFFYNLSYSQSIIMLLLIYLLHKSLGYTKSSQSSLVISWQRIYNSLTVTTAHARSSFHMLSLLLTGWLLTDNWTSDFRLTDNYCWLLVIQIQVGPHHIENTASTIVVFTVPQHSNISYPITSCVFVAAGMCLASHCIEMGLHVTI
jgi:hypothetical protein